MQCFIGSSVKHKVPQFVRMAQWGTLQQAEFLYLLPMIQRRHYSLHVRPYLLGGPVLGCHVFYTKINQLFFTFIGENAVYITPFAVCFIKIAVWFFTYGTIINGHSAALADQLSRRAQQCVD